MSDEQQAQQAAPSWADRGWLVPYLLGGDTVFGHGRLNWWLDSALTGQLPPGPIPQIEFRSTNSTEVRPDLVDLSNYLLETSRKDKRKGYPLSPKGAVDHLRTLADRGRDVGLGRHEALYQIIRCLAYWLAVGQSTERPWRDGGPSAQFAELLYRDLDLGRLQAADADVFGDLLSEFGHQGAAFFPTPMEVCTLMVQMVGHDERDRDMRLASCCDPCVGTGRMLLVASNLTCNLYGSDIDVLLVDACAVNLALFAPWGVYLTPIQREMLSRPWPTLAGDQRIIESLDVTRQEQGHEPLPSTLVELDGVTPEGEPLPCAGEVQRVYAFDRHGQGELFSVPARRDGSK